MQTTLQPTTSGIDYEFCRLYAQQFAEAQLAHYSVLRFYQGGLVAGVVFRAAISLSSSCGQA